MTATAKTWGTISYIPDGPTQSGAVWVIEATPHVMTKLKRYFPRVRAHRAKRLTIAHTPEVARDLLWFTQRWPMEFDDDDTLKALRRGDREHRKREQQVISILDGHSPPAGKAWLELSDEYERREEQFQAADLCLSTGGLLLGDLVGKGKTLSSLLILRNPAALPCWIVTLTHLPEQWRAELNRAFPMLRVHVLRGTTPYNIAERREMKGHEPDVVISGYSKIAGWADYLAGKVSAVIFDEVHELRRHGNSAEDLSLKYAGAGRVRDEATFCMGASGTPVYNYGPEIFNVMDVIQPGCFGTREEFHREWCSTRDGKLVVTDPVALGQHLRDEGLFLRRGWPADDLDPKVIPHVIDADDDVYADLTGDALELARVILNSDDKTEVFRASGEIDWRLREATGIAKAPFVADFTRMLLDQGRTVLLFGWHHAVYRIWGERLDDFDPVFYTGKQSNAQKREAQRRFMEGETRLMVMSLRAGAGLDGLQQVCQTAVFGELDWSPRMHDQCLGRLDPRRSTPPGDEPALGYFLHSTTGSDPYMVEVLNLKDQQSRPMVDPDAPILAEVPDHSKHIREMAEEFLRQRERGADLEEVAA